MDNAIYSLASLSRALNLDVGYTYRLTKKPWWPAKAKNGWDLEACRQAIGENVRVRKPRNQDPPEQVSAPPIVADDDPLLRTLLRGDSSPLQISRAAVQLAARTYGKGLACGSVGARALDELKRVLEELRRAEEDYLNLEIRQGNLIPRDVAKAVAGGLAGRLVGVINNLESILATQVEIWMGDVGFRDLATENRSRQVRDWFAAQARSLREMEADEIEAMVADEIEEQKEVNT